MIEFGSWTMQAYYIQQSAKRDSGESQVKFGYGYASNYYISDIEEFTLHWFDYTAMTSLSIVLNYTHSAELCKECMRGVSV